ncbi:protease SohB [Aeromonas cavernicola]|uniref:Protease SohB n=1 Tax=Aeromonas cavernicola TaxID=1006623 RepID=A0A2H9U3B5_9GAMM|nr:protease SohB [Aeromonas cavernicola]PJG58459.1 protease SohB [Aeromonas cavernicola]
MTFLTEYGLFLAKIVTCLLAIAALIVLVMSSRQPRARKGELVVTDLSSELEQGRYQLQLALADKAQGKLLEKQHKAQQKQRDKAVDDRSRLFVLDFNGSMDAKEVASLREEVSAVIGVAQPGDEVLLRLESGGGVVHGYGLAASQLQRLRDKGIKLTVAIDKVAASGGYMMACVADQILAAPFAIVGSIGVIAQLPNFNKLLKKHDIEFEMHTAGQYKRTITMFGENDDLGREKFREELAAIHQQFKAFVAEHRPQLDIDQVTTGEHWLASQAKALGLVDLLSTSDDYLLAQASQHKVIGVSYRKPKSLAQKLGQQGAQALATGLGRLWQQSPWR